MADYDLAPEEPSPEKRGSGSPKPVKREGVVKTKGGTEPSSSAVSPVSSATPTASLEERLCPHCGFKMVGKKRIRCPECSAPLDSAATDLLQFSGNLWIRWISWGPLVMALAAPLHVVAVVMIWKGMATGGAFLHAVGAVLLCVGTWIATAQEVGGQPQRRKLWGHLARWSTVAGALVWWGFLLYSFSKHAGPPPGATIGVLLLMAFESISLALFMQGVSQRIPNDGLAVQFQNLTWVMPVLLGVLMVAQNMSDLPAFINSVFFFTFPLLGGMAGIMAWATATLIKLSLELRNVVAANESIAQKRLQKAKPST